MRIAVFGAGAWGTALAQAFAAAHEIILWGREADHIAETSAARENLRFLPGVPLHPAITLSADFDHAASSAGLHLIVTPLAGLRNTAQALRQHRPTPLIWACKGLEADSGRLPHQIVAEELGPSFPCAMLTGPSFALEVARGLPAAAAIASNDADFATEWVQALHQPRLRLYANTDLVGCEVGAALKNVIAIAAGVSDGMNFGLNARAALMTRSLAEIARLAAALGGHPETLMGLAGMGDLILTCTGDLSRNRQVGLALASGKTLPDILTSLGHVAEGVSTARAVAALAQKIGVDMPICTAIDALLHHGLNARDAVEQLLARDPKQESFSAPRP
ncbi:glycerol-3-phosphate dehydrogenase [NAD(P)+] [Betaproteobacteria bacterium]|nr:glycerol-3-phosphate dehydrogenase [NAD(P)+] [Betaproteobacteria bacterium]GHU23439.1 glycerol-3-phosphate dehydrogenase [NAD(P)+] [Betaproteobacteria bacterium]